MMNSRLMAAVAALFLAGCSKQETAGTKATNEAASGNPITAPVDYLGAVAKAKHAAEKTIDLASVNQAVQLFYAQEDRFPRDLNELVAKHYIAAIPPTPAGRRWAYNSQTGELKAVQQQ